MDGDLKLGCWDILWHGFVKHIYDNCRKVCVSEICHWDLSNLRQFSVAQSSRLTARLDSITPGGWALCWGKCFKAVHLIDWEQRTTPGPTSSSARPYRLTSPEPEYWEKSNYTPPDRHQREASLASERFLPTAPSKLQAMPGKSKIRDNLQNEQPIQFTHYISQKPGKIWEGNSIRILRDSGAREMAQWVASLAEQAWGPESKSPASTSANHSGAW